MDSEVLIPANGRDYKSKKAFEKDLRNGKDFLICTSPGKQLCSIRDFDKGLAMECRYDKLKKVTIITI